MTATTLATLVLQDLGILQEGSSPSAAQAEQVRLRATNMVTGWQTQYGTVTSIDRTVFGLVANKQTYTIGLGGDFNVPRPLTIPGAALWLSALSSAEPVTSITRSGLTATVTRTAHGFAVGDEAFIAGALQSGYNGLQTVQTVPTVDTFAYTVFNQPPITPATGTLTVASVSGQPVEIPYPVITVPGYAGLALKNMPNSQFTAIYYSPTYPYGQIALWPRINTTENSLILYLQNVFSGFADLTTDYTFPDLPGYAEALQYQLDLRMAVPYGVELTEHVKDMAKQTFGLIKRANTRMTDLPNDATWVGGSNPRGGYNINTGTGG